MKETTKNSTTVENTLFKFMPFNIPRLQTSSKLIKFKLSKLLTINLIKAVLYTKSHSKETRKYRIYVGIRMGEISVMRLGEKAKFNQYVIH